MIEQLVSGQKMERVFDIHVQNKDELDEVYGLLATAVRMNQGKKPLLLELWREVK